MSALNNPNSGRLPERLQIFAMAFLGCEVTAALVNIFDLPSVPASAATAMVAVCLGLRLRLSHSAPLAVYAGTFAGMGVIPLGSPMLLWLTAMSLVAASVIVAFHCLQPHFPKHRIETKYLAPH